MNWVSRSELRFAAPLGLNGLCVCSAMFALALLTLSASAAQPAKPPSQRLLDAEKSFSSPEGYPSRKLAIFIEEADAGSADAKRDLGLVYRYDPLLSLQWFEAAAVAGDVRAPSYIGDFYLDKTNGVPDPANAVYWYTQGYQRSDARAAIALASFQCSGAKVDLQECGRLLDAATKFSKPSDPADVLPSMQLALFNLGAAYETGKIVRRNPAAAQIWYGKSAALGYAAAAFAQVRLYIEPHGLPRNLARATSITDAIASFETAHKPLPRGMIPDYAKIAAIYNEIGALYEKQNTPSSLHLAAAVYVKASALGYGKPAVALAIRYTNGDRTPRNLDAALKLLMAVLDDPYTDEDPGSRAALVHLVTVLKAGQTPGDAHRITLAEKALAPRVRVASPPPMAAEGALAPPPPPMTERYPNISGPPNDTATTQQTFSVQVSLDTIAFDAGTQILSGNNDNGKLQIQLPAGMTTMPIQVDLIVPSGITFINGDTNSSSLILDSTKPNSTPAIFHLQAGAVPFTGIIRATLSYHQNFLAQLARPITIVAANSDTAPPNKTSVPAPVVSLPPPAQASSNTPSAADAGRGNSGPLVEKAIVQPHNTGANPPNVGLNAPHARVLQEAPPPPKTMPVVIDPSAKSTDLTIVETLDGDTMHYAFDSPGLVGIVYADVPNAAATRAKIQNDFNLLQSDSINVLSAGGVGSDVVLCTAAHAKGSGDKDPSCSDSLKARADLQGIGYDLFSHDAPPEFRTIYQLLLSEHIRLHTITVVTNSPLLPWELMLPQQGTDNYLGLTAAIVRQNAAAPQLAASAEMPFQNIAVIVPNYSGGEQLPAVKQEVASIKSDFPQAQEISGDTDAVGAMLRSDPQTIIHYSGHGQRIAVAAAAPAGTAPQSAVVLEDNSITPTTFTAFRAEGETAHPFYFFNACYLGLSDNQANYIVGWAPALMDSGATGYLGALYQVGDTSAASFAAHFYANLKASLSTSGTLDMADIVTQARRQTYAEAYDPTALAYVLYAKPYMKLVAPQ
jgi:TPR repeat protein